jgi:hypothetical protein
MKRRRRREEAEHPTCRPIFSIVSLLCLSVDFDFGLGLPSNDGSNGRCKVTYRQLTILPPDFGARFSDSAENFTKAFSGSLTPPTKLRDFAAFALAGRGWILVTSRTFWSFHCSVSSVAASGKHA